MLVIEFYRSLMHEGDRQSFMVYHIPQSSKSLCYDRVCANIHWFSELCNVNAGGRQHAMRLKEKDEARVSKNFCRHQVDGRTCPWF